MTAVLISLGGAGLVSGWIAAFVLALKNGGLKTTNAALNFQLGQTADELDLTRKALAAADARKRAGDSAAEEEIHVLEEKLVAGPGGGGSVLRDLGMRPNPGGGTSPAPGPLSIRTPVRLPVMGD